MLEIATYLLIAFVFFSMLQFLGSELKPKPRWKSMFLCASIVALSSVSRVVRADVAPDTWTITFLMFGTVMMIYSVLVVMPRDDRMLR